MTDDAYFTLAELAAYSRISVSQLRKYLALPPGQALPCRRLGRKLIIQRREFDVWCERFRARGKPVITRVMRELGLDPALPDTRKPLAKVRPLAGRSPREARHAP